jgi:hypothetical protein
MTHESVRSLIEQIRSAINRHDLEPFRGLEAFATGAAVCFESRQHAAGSRRVHQQEHARSRAGTADTRSLLVRPSQVGQPPIVASVRLIDQPEYEVAAIERELQALDADHRYVPLLTTVAGIGWVLLHDRSPLPAADADRSDHPREQAPRQRRPLGDEADVPRQRHDYARLWAEPLNQR